MRIARTMFGMALAVASPALADDLDKSLCAVRNKAQAREAIAACTRFINDRATLGDDRIFALNDRARHWSVLGDEKRKNDDYIAILRLPAASGKAYRLRVAGRKLLNDERGIIEDMTQAIRLEPAEPANYYWRARFLRRTGQHDRAIADASVAINLRPNYAFAFQERADAHTAKGDMPRALSDYTGCITANPNMDFCLMRRAEIQVRQKNYEPAIADFTASLRITEENPRAYYGRGKAFLEKREPARAVAEFTRAAELARTVTGDKAALPQDLQLYTDMLNVAKVEAARSLGSAPNRPVANNSPVNVPVPNVAPTPPPQPSIAVAPKPVEGKRVALVIGNSSYQSVAALPNPLRDADALAGTLRKIGFSSVKQVNNASFEMLRSALRDFSSEAENADWAVVYYAGHGLEIGGVNFLIPVDAKLKSDRDAQLEAVTLDQVLGSVEGARKLRLVILDACRDNPFVAQMAKSNGTRSVGRGLGRVEPEGNTLVAYAAKAGQVAMDGDGANSPFVTSLMKRLAAPKVEIRKLFGLVHDDVLAATGRKQEPFVYGALGGDDYFINPN